MGEPVECGPRQPFAAQDLGPVFKGQIGRHDQAETFVGRADHIEQQLRAEFRQGNADHHRCTKWDLSGEGKNDPSIGQQPGDRIVVEPDHIRLFDILGCAQAGVKDLSLFGTIPAGYGFGFELKLKDTTANKSKPMIDKVTLTFE
tara:strand:+ start:4842 stop:5276 length:435 start_codon:yes stop_codon:yes gene_type:complete